VGFRNAGIAGIVAPVPALSYGVCRLGIAWLWQNSELPGAFRDPPPAPAEKTKLPMHEMLASLIQWYLEALDQGGYWLIGLLMAMESSILPVPSEFVIPPAAYLSHSKGTFTLTGIVIAGTVGSWVGASVMYWASYLIGRPLLMKYGRYVMITPEKIQQAEAWSSHYGMVGVFISRLLPVIRHLIGIPAGVVRMHFGWYSLATIIGSGIWCAVLCWVGVTAGQDEQLMQGNLHRITLWVGGLLVFLGSLYYFFVHRQMRR
jgi:membrane protein DedA with SNARE-associated domain